MAYANLLHERNKYKYYNIYRAVRKQRHKMHTFKRREKKKNVAAILIV